MLDPTQQHRDDQHTCQHEQRRPPRSVDEHVAQRRAGAVDQDGRVPDGQHEDQCPQTDVRHRERPGADEPVGDPEPPGDGQQDEAQQPEPQDRERRRVAVPQRQRGEHAHVPQHRADTDTDEHPPPPGTRHRGREHDGQQHHGRDQHALGPQQRQPGGQQHGEQRVAQGDGPRDAPPRDGDEQQDPRGEQQVPVDVERVEDETVVGDQQGRGATGDPAPQPRTEPGRHLAGQQPQRHRGAHGHQRPEGPQVARLDRCQTVHGTGHQRPALQQKGRHAARVAVQRQQTRHREVAERVRGDVNQRQRRGRQQRDHADGRRRRQSTALPRCSRRDHVFPAIRQGRCPSQGHQQSGPGPRDREPCGQQHEHDARVHRDADRQRDGHPPTRPVRRWRDEPAGHSQQDQRGSLHPERDHAAPPRASASRSAPTSHVRSGPVTTTIRSVLSPSRRAMA